MVDTLFFKSAPEWDSNQLPLDYESEVQTTTLSLHIIYYKDVIMLNISLTATAILQEFLIVPNEANRIWFHTVYLGLILKIK